MKKYILFIISFVFVHTSFSQVAPSRYQVKFTDKNNSPYSISNPSAFLSSRAIERRFNYSILITEQDLPVNPSYVQGITNTGAVLLNSSKWFNSVTIRTTDSTVLTAIQNLPYVASVTPVAQVATNSGGSSKFNNTYSESSKRLSVTSTTTYDYGQSFNQINMIGGVALHDAGYKGADMVIAVLDAGFYNVNVLPAFDSIRNNNQILGTWDFVENNSSVYEDHSHGMSVLSTMAGNVPGQLVGTAPKASYWLLRTEDAATEYVIEELNWAAGAEFADSVGADVINSSLGYTTFDDASQNHTYSDMNGNTTIVTKAADIAASKGILVVNSAGNSGGSSWQYIGAPADGDSVFSIGAVDANESYVSFSSTGPTVDGRIKPNVAAQGYGTIVALAGGGIAGANGTSFSGPVMAGMAASLWQANRELNNMEIIKAIQESADQYTNPDQFKGYGVPDFSVALAAIGVNDLKKRSALVKFFPNPFHDELICTVYSDSPKNLELQLADVCGKILVNETEWINAGSLATIKVSDLKDLAAGIYFVKVALGNETVIQKMVKF